ncbi:DUF5914 domain-containing protein, partial [Streptomyces sp. WELS2]|uniref:DUF5914 domain-containing protein n=1 Tax=Streptomyces sp. WELS2 TaxID=2749435 RepID=UPI00215D84C4
MTLLRDERLAAAFDHAARGYDTLVAANPGYHAHLRRSVGGEEPLDAPVVPPRPEPARALTAVYTGVGACEPEDVVANRLDPWHGAWLHPYAFADLTVVDAPGDPAGAVDGGPDALTVDVSFKVAGRIVVPVRAVFTAPGPRTVVMRVCEGEGAGSVVETHA